jgi:antitoxin HigA-1
MLLFSGMKHNHQERRGMARKKHPTPGDLIGDTLDELKVSIVTAATGLGIMRQQLHHLIAGRSGITPEMAVKLEKAIGGKRLAPA